MRSVLRVAANIFFFSKISWSKKCIMQSKNTVSWIYFSRQYMNVHWITMSYILFWWTPVKKFESHCINKELPEGTPIMPGELYMPPLGEGPSPWLASWAQRRFVEWIFVATLTMLLQEFTSWTVWGQGKCTVTVSADGVVWVFTICSCRSN